MAAPVPHAAVGASRTRSGVTVTVRTLGSCLRCRCHRLTTPRRLRSFTACSSSASESSPIPVVDEDGVQHRMSPTVTATHRPWPDGSCLDDRQRYPCRSALHTALFVELPVAWMPTQLAAVLSATACGTGIPRTATSWNRAS
jgi:hypothetical protein